MSFFNTENNSSHPCNRFYLEFNMQTASQPKVESIDIIPASSYTADTQHSNSSERKESDRNEHLLYKLNKLLEDRQAVTREALEIAKRKLSEWLVERRPIVAEYVGKARRVIDATLREILDIDPNMTNSKGETVLHLATAHGDVEVLCFLLQISPSNKLDIMRKNCNGQTALEFGLELANGNPSKYTKLAMWALVLGHLHRQLFIIPLNELVNHAITTNNPFLLTILLVYAVLKNRDLEPFHLERYTCEDPFLKELLRWGLEKMDTIQSETEIICTPGLTPVMELRHYCVWVAIYLINEKEMRFMIPILLGKLQEYEIFQQ